MNESLINTFYLQFIKKYTNMYTDMQLNNNLKEKGFFYFEDFLEKKNCYDIECFFDTKFEKIHNNKSTIKIESYSLDKYQILNSIEKKISNFLKKEIEYKFFLRNIWMINNNYANYNNLDRQYNPHIDIKRYLKVFLYIKDVEKKDGPLTVSTNQSPSENEKKRIDHNMSGNKNDQIGFSLTDEYNFFPMIFKAGTIICFDTNTPHYAGEMKKDGFRKVLRFNYFSTFSKYQDKKFLYDYYKSKLSRLKKNLFGF